MNNQLHLVPLIICVILGLGLVLKSDEVANVYLYSDEGLELREFMSVDTAETGVTYRLLASESDDSDFVKGSNVTANEDSLDWQIFFLGDQNSTFFISSEPILFHEFEMPGDYEVRSLKNQMLYAVDTLTVVDGFNDGVRNYVPGRILEDSIFKLEDYTENAVKRTWRITAMDSIEYQVVDTTLESGVLQLKLSKPGDYSVFLAVENENGKRQVSDPVILEVYQDQPDVDTDGDGIFDSEDLFPEDEKEWADSDLDGYGDNKDRFPNDPSEWYDLDRDGIGNNSDDDIDGDGYSNADDCYDYNPRLHKCPTKDNSAKSELDDDSVDENRGSWGTDADLEGSNEITSGFDSPLREMVEFRSGECSITIKPQINLQLKNFDYWSGPIVGKGVQICIYRIECIDCVGEGTMIQRPFSTPQNNNRSEQMSCGQVLLAGNTYRVTLSTEDDARLGFIPVPHDERKKVIENKLEMEYEGSQTAIFELIFEN